MAPLSAGWQDTHDDGGDGGGTSRWVRRIVAAGRYVMAAGDGLVTVDADGDAVTLVLPAPGPDSGACVKIKRLSAASVTLETDDPSHMESGASDALDLNGAGLEMASDGVIWVVL